MLTWDTLHGIVFPAKPSRKSTYEIGQFKVTEFAKRPLDSVDYSCQPQVRICNPYTKNHTEQSANQAKFSAAKLDDQADINHTHGGNSIISLTT